MSTSQDKPEPGRTRRARRGSGRTTIADVAALAGVAPITVSRALRGLGTVTAELRERIDTAVQQLGYEPDPAARALASARSDILGVMVPSLSNIVFADVMRGIYDQLGDSQLQVQIANSHYSPIEEERLLKAFLRQRPAAIIISGIDQNEGARALLESAECPIVQIMEYSDNPVDMLVGFSQFDAGAAAAEHLVQSGYRRPGFMGARMDPRSQRRLAGYRRTMENAGLFDPDLITTTMMPSSIPLGRQLLIEAFRKAPDLDAVFCNNDDLAMGALFECQHAGISVPSRFGICGFNDLDMMGAAYPALSSVETPRYDIGRRAVQLIQGRLAGEPAKHVAEDLGYTLRARASTQR